MLKPIIILRKSIFVLALMFASVAASAQVFDLTRQQPVYTDAVGYGYDIVKAPEKKEAKPFFFSVQVPDGNYKVTVTVGSKKKKAETDVRAENRRLFLEPVVTRKGELKTYTFVINKRSTNIDGKHKVLIKNREKDYLHWDNRLTLEFNGAAPAVRSIEITPDTTAFTIFLCGNSTVVDQQYEPWASWGQMFPRWFNDKVAVCNLAESGLTAGSFLAQGRLDYIVAKMKKGDYVFCEFGHNDQKEKTPGSGAWYNFSYELKKFADVVRSKGGIIVFITPTQRRAFDKERQHILETHGEYPDAMRAVAQREKIPVIELHDMTRTFFEALGYENSKKALVHYPAGTFPGQEKDFADNTHFNTFGAYEVSKMVVMGMKQLNLPVVKNLRADWKDFDPSRPDDWNKFYLPRAPFYENVKPDGN